MSKKSAHRLVDVDERQGLALGIFSTDDKVLHAIGRYCVETARTAEVAFVARESKRKCGVATALLRELGRCAQAHGIEFFCARVLRENYSMRRMLVRHNPTVTEDPAGDQLEYLLNVRQPNQLSGSHGLA